MPHKKDAQTHKSTGKKLALFQRLNFERLFPDPNFAFELIQFPDSSILLDEIKRIADSRGGDVTRGAAQSFDGLLDFAKSQDGKCILLLPGLSPQVGFIYAQYPAIKVESRVLPFLLNFVKVKFDAFDYLALTSEDLKHGVVLDVYAENSEIEGTDEEVCKTTVW